MGLLCLDLDGTLVESSLVERDGKLQPALGLFTEPRLRPNVYDVIQRSALEGDSFAIVTNQGGVAWGYATAEEAYARISRTIGLLDCFFGRPLSIHVCFAHPRATIERYREGHYRRKPNPSMIFEATAAHGDNGIGVTGKHEEPVLMVGDLDDDKRAAVAAGVDFVHASEFFTW